MKKLMLGNEAIARGAYEAGVRVVSSYPGTPSTEITEYAAQYDEMFSEWAPNEKVAMEVALGASIGGGRALTAMKHVGLNVAADPLFTASYTGVNAGLVICVADDQGMHSSQNEQDSRTYANSSKTLMLEPSDSDECLRFTKIAFDLSETYDTPVLLRLSTRISHSQSQVTLSDRTEKSVKPYERNMAKYVMMPAMARGRHVVVEERIKTLKAFVETSDLNCITYHDKKIGIIAAGIAYQYAKEALGEHASYLKLGVVYPLPSDLLKQFVESVDVCYVIEELEPIIENHCKVLGLSVIGKEKFSLIGEYASKQIKEVILGEHSENISIEEEIPARPPVMCAGCPHRGVFYILNQLKLNVFGDIGCYTLGALAPLNALDTCICMGSSIGLLHGAEKAAGRDFATKSVSVIGDSTFMHTGLNGLVDVVYNKGTSTVIILDNSITGMTGHQQNPTTGRTIKNEPTKQIDLELLCRAIGVERVVIVDPFDAKELKRVLKEELAAEEPSVIITQRPCALLKSVKYEGCSTVDADKCKNCGMCMKIGCPAIVTKGDKAHIVPEQCVGCGYCQNICAFHAITKAGEKESVVTVHA